MHTSKVKTVLGLVAILIIIAAFVAFVLYRTLGLPVVSEHEKQLLSNGIQAPALVLRILPGGGKQNGQNVESRYELEVQPEGKTAYTVEVTTFVLIRKLANLVPGAIITVKYDAQNPLDVVIVQ